MMKDHLIRRILVGLVATCCGLSAADFAAVGPVKETKLPPEKHLGAVKVTFDLQPTTMSFDLPWHFCAVAENGLKLAWSWIVAPELQLPGTRLSPNGSAGQYHTLWSGADGGRGVQPSLFRKRINFPEFLGAERLGRRFRFEDRSPRFHTVFIPGSISQRTIEPSDFKAFYALTVAPADLPEWKATLA
jgi:hypothetical protein